MSRNYRVVAPPDITREVLACISREVCTPPSPLSPLCSRDTHPARTTSTHIHPSTPRASTGTRRRFSYLFAFSAFTKSPPPPRHTGAATEQRYRTRRARGRVGVLYIDSRRVRHTPSCAPAAHCENLFQRRRRRGATHRPVPTEAAPAAGVTVQLGRGGVCVDSRCCCTAVAGGREWEPPLPPQLGRRRRAMRARRAWRQSRPVCRSCHLDARIGKAARCPRRPRRPAPSGLTKSRRPWRMPPPPRSGMHTCRAARRERPSPPKWRRCLPLSVTEWRG